MDPIAQESSSQPPFASAIAAWDTPRFAATLIDTLTRLGARFLPLQKGLTQGSVALDDDLMLRVLHTEAQGDHLLVRVSVQYTSIITGCSCVDDPTPENILPEYCELELIIDRQNGTAKVELL